MLDRSLVENTPSIGIAVITHKAKHHLPKCLPPLIQSPLKPRVLVVNSSSHDGTVELAQELGADTLVIPRADFNHGATREKARKVLNTDIVVMVTPDAYAVDQDVIGKLVAPLINRQTSVAYARQLPHDGAGFFEAFPRYFNYPAQSHIRGLEDLKKWGLYTYFCSNSCAAYLNAALDEIGGFQPVLTGEDTIAVSKLLHLGHKIAYVAEACVQHSHRYSLRQEFRRHFDTGLARKQYQNLLKAEERDEKRGRAYTLQFLKSLTREKPHLLPYGVLTIASKLLGYKMGRASLKAPLWWKKALSSQDFYWISKYTSL